MASEMLRILTKQGTKHNVGSINTIKFRTVNQGAICTSDLDNYVIVDTNFNEEGERTCSLVADETKKGYLLASPENVMADLGENLASFFNGKGERGRLVILDFGLRFECSNVEASDGSSPIKVGQMAYFDTTKKSFVVDVKGSDSKMGTAVHKFMVVDADANTLAGKQTIRLEVQ